jgi:hypothetical protein
MSDSSANNKLPDLNHLLETESKGIRDAFIKLLNDHLAVHGDALDAKQKKTNLREKLIAAASEMKEE